jgi:flagellar hook-associated protein 2
MTSSITFSGISSGLDSASIISQLMAVEAIPQNNLKTKVSTEQNQLSALQAINTSLASLFTSAQSFSTGSTWTQIAATSTNAAFSVTATSDATQSSLNVSVQQSATKASVVLTGSNPFAAGGTYQVASGGTTTSFTVGGTGTISDVAAAINGGSAASGLRAVVLDPNGTPSLEIVSVATGAASNFTITSGAATLADSTDTSVAGVTKALDAQLTVDNVPMTSSTNSVTVAAGVTVTIPSDVSASGSPQSSTISVSDDGSNKANAVKTFISQVNGVLTSISGATSYGTVPTGDGAAATDGGVLPGDSTLRSLSDQLVNAIFPADGTSLENIGISVDRYGQLTFDSDKFTAAYAADPTGTQNAILGKDTGTQQLGSDLAMHEVYSDGFASRIADIAKLWTQSPSTDDPSTPLANAALAKGGLLGQYIASFQDQISDLNDQISEWDDRLAAKQSSLQTIYTNLETTLSKLQSQSSWLSSQIDGLNGTSSSSSSS